MPRSLLLFFVVILLCSWSTPCLSQFAPGELAPDFTLEDVYGRPYQLAAMKESSLIVLYFFDTASPASQEGLLTLNQLLSRFKEKDLLVWGITKATTKSISDFLTTNKVSFPVMHDHKGVSATYQAESILPTIYILGPKRKVIDFFQGGGQSTEKMLISLAEKELQRNEPLVAQAISLKAQAKNPASLEAKTLYGYAALKADKVDEAENTFQSLAQESGEGEILGKEGLAKVYVQQGKLDKAMAVATEVEAKAPDRGAANVIKGGILYAQNKKEEAKIEYQLAVKKPAGSVIQKAEAHNQLGRLYADAGNLKQARINYDQTVELDPYNIVAMSNKGVAYQKEGQLNKALEMFQQALTINQNDQFSAVLARKTQEMMDLQRNIAAKQRIDRLVKELAARFRSQKETAAPDRDTWTSRPLVLSFIDFQEKGGLNERDGMSMVLTSQLGDRLNQSGRVQVVERVIMDRLLEELNLGSSELADPATALQLGRVLAAKLIATGTLLHLPDQSLLSLRLIDTETTAIPQVLTEKLASGALDIDQELERVNREILQTVMEKYPLQGFIVQVNGEQAVLNIGERQGVVMGTSFDVIEQGEPIEYKGRKLQGLAKTVARLEVVQVQPDMSVVRILESERPLRQDDKVAEKIQPMTRGGRS
ncbi:MAG: redoxin domain-containing protein [Candidatus Electrothrix sp. GW3-4]|uniref:redoxin domain-containing protein n=1 Tax=Candidatus Electrothrix sp. GW3-4 TaxID=3126740 RepID=UPI0030D04E66